MSGHEALTLREYTKQYFYSHQTRLLDQYPGLTLTTLYQKLESFGLYQQLALESLFEQIYLPSPMNPISQFFTKLEKGIPLSYITGNAFFFRSEFTVAPGVLIPRPETEILVEYAVNFLKKRKNHSRLSIVDVGVGSGAIVLSVLRECPFPIEAMATDISDLALRIAKRNHYQLRYTFHPESEVSFLKADRLSDINLTFDLIMSNPPYIPWEPQQDTGVHPQVLNHEPKEALFLARVEYQDWFFELFRQSAGHLKKGGVFIMEGHENELQALQVIAQKANLKNVKILHDLTGRDRFLTATIEDENG